MKDMTSRDVFPRFEAQPNQVVNRIDGHWRFIQLRWQDGLLKSDGARYFYYSIPFGIVLGGEANPRRIYKHGNVGDFLVHNPGGYYDIITKAEYDIRFGSGDGYVEPSTQPASPTSTTGMSLY